MPGDINADARYEMEQEIRNKENKIDEFSQEKAELEKHFEEFRSDMLRTFNQSSALYEKMAEAGNQSALNERETNSAIKGVLDSMTDQNQEEMELHYRKKRLELEDEIEHLYQEKGALPWE